MEIRVRCGQCGTVVVEEVPDTARYFTPGACLVCGPPDPVSFQVLTTHFPVEG